MRYSLAYLERGEPTRDSSRFRRRLYAAQIEIRGLAGFLTRELGVSVREQYGGGATLSFFMDADLRDILDYISLAYDYARETRNLNSAARHREAVQRILDEENIAYTVDGDCLVHPRVDAAFAAAQESAIAAIAAARYGNVRDQFESAERALNQADPDFKQAVRAVFNANEALFRLIADRAPRLGNRELRDHLGPIVDRIYGDDPTARRAAARNLSAFGEWVDSAHNYRHEQGQEEPSQPPEALALALISEGVGYLRWLAKIDQGQG